MPTSEPKHRSISPTDSSGGDRKRRRKTLSCQVCRRRKLSCDRGYPACSRCIKSGCSEECIYDTKPIPDSEEPLLHSTLEVAPDQIRQSAHQQLQSIAHRPSFPYSSTQVTDPYRLFRAQKKLHSGFPSVGYQGLSGKPSVDQTATRLNFLYRFGQAPTSSAELLGDEEEASGSDCMFLRGKEFKTQFYGYSSSMSTIAQFPDLHDFMKDHFRRDGTTFRKDLQFAKEKRKRNAISVASLHVTDIEVPSLLPSKETADALVQSYLQHHESTYRILHVPTFTSQYEQLWAAPSEARPGFIVIVLLVCAIARVLSPLEPLSFVGDSSLGRETANNWVLCCQNWLMRQSNKHNTLELVQIHCLIYLSRKICALKVKQMWTFAGNLLRYGLSIGLHRDPSALGSRISPFIQEMRRRIWYTMVELEFHASIDKGMPPASSAYISDVAAPLNIFDEDFGPDSKELPEPHPLDTYTPTSYLCLSHKSLQMRSHIAVLINRQSFPHSTPYDNILELEEDIGSLINTYPDWTRIEELNSSSDESPGFLAARLLIRIQLWQLQVLINNPYSKQLKSRPKRDIARHLCLTASLSIINAYTKNDVPVLTMLRSDIFQATLTICQCITSMKKEQPGNPVLNAYESAVVPIFEKALAVLEDKTLRLGIGFLECYYATGALCYLSATFAGTDLNKITPDTILGMMKKIVRVAHKILAYQADGPQLPAGVCIKMDKLGQFQNGGTSNQLTQSMSAATNDDFDPTLGLDNSSWVFGDFWNLDLPTW